MTDKYEDALKAMPTGGDTLKSDDWLILYGKTIHEALKLASMADEMAKVIKSLNDSITMLDAPDWFEYKPEVKDVAQALARITLAKFKEIKG